MFCKIDNYLRILYRFSGYVAAFFLILVATFILIGIASRIFDFYIRGLAEYSGYCMAASSFLALAYTFSENGHIRITLFLEKTKDTLSEIGLKHLPLAAKTMIFIMALRFLTDYLNNDIYYKTNYSEHNLDRAKNQFKLIESFTNQINKRCSL